MQNTSSRRTPQRTRAQARFARTVWSLMAFGFTPFLIGTLFALAWIKDTLIHPSPEPIEYSNVPQVQIAPNIPVALFLLSNQGVQTTDLLATYEILGLSGEFQLVTTAPKRELVTTTSRLAILPDSDFAHAPEADLIVLPALLDTNDSLILDYPRSQAPRAKLVLAPLRSF